MTMNDLFCYTAIAFEWAIMIALYRTHAWAILSLAIAQTFVDSPTVVVLVRYWRAVHPGYDQNMSDLEDTFAEPLFADDANETDYPVGIPSEPIIEYDACLMCPHFYERCPDCDIRHE